MNPDAPLSPREELEVRLTAWLMGELSPEEAAALQAQMASDPELAALHARLRHALGLLREASALPEPAAPPAPVRLSSERRERLLAHFKAVPFQLDLAAPQREWRSLVPLALAAALIALIGGALLLETFSAGRSQPVSFDLEVAATRGGVASNALQSPPAAAEERQWASQPGALRSWGEGGARGHELALAPSERMEVTGGRKFNLPKPSAESVRLPALTKSGSGTLYLPIPSATPASQPATEAPAPIPGPLPALAAASASAESKESPAQVRRLFRNPSPQTRIATGAVEVAAAEPFGVSAPLSTAGKVELPPGPAGGMGGGGAGRGEKVPESSVANGDRPTISSLLPVPPPVDFNSDVAANTGAGRPADAKPPMLGDIPITGSLFSTKRESASGAGAREDISGQTRTRDKNIRREALEKDAFAEYRAPLVLNDSNTYSGGTTVNGGTLVLGDSGNVSGGFADSGKLTGKSASPTDRRTSESEGVKGVKHHWSGQFENQLGASTGTTAFAITPTTPTAFDSRIVVKDGDFDGFTNYGSAIQQQGAQPQGIDPSATPGISNYRVFSSGGVTADAGRGVSAPDGTAAILFGGSGVIANAGQGIAPDGGINQAKNDPSGKGSSTTRFYRNVDELRFISPTADPSAPEAPDKPDAPDKPMEVAKLLEPAQKQELKELEKEEPVSRKPAPAAPVPQPEIQTSANAFSTFSLNVSDVSFKLAAASLEQGQMPEPSGVRSEEFINAFDYRDPEPAADAPLACATERARYPFAQNRDLLRCSVKTAAAGRQPGRALNVVLLLDNSGSMERADRVRIVREALRVLAGQLQPQDKLSIITFARTPRLWADGVAGNESGAVCARVGEITPQGGTNIAAALDLGYQTALRHYQVGSINRVVLLTDGAANLGDVDPDALKQKVEAHRKQGIALDCFGIGWEGLNDDLLEQLSRNGDGRYGFINTPEEAATEFAGQLAGALRVAASDVKVQVEFNPRRVTAYRQIGYAKHQLTKEQFRDNTVDAAEIGAAESGNALYVVEVNPRGEGDLATVRVRFKVPGTSDYQEHEWAVPFISPAVPLEQASPALRLAGAASAFSEMLAASPYAAEVNSDRLLSLLNGVPAIYGADPRPQKLEWMIRQAKSLSGR
ncbi:MAG: Ca-activated chloride channel [Chthoniobacter sp.]|jgi:autotransporter-associated beta strand protein|nr:Ca-activated chloride channel [Chthoniobacter sp.]